jgi:hypothetical protein
LEWSCVIEILEKTADVSFTFKSERAAWNGPSLGMAKGLFREEEEY